jgi:2'-5' RNA ligase
VPEGTHLALIKSHRIFLAIPLSPAFEKEAGRCREFNGNMERVKWVPTPNFHITQYFFGNVIESLLEPIQQNIEDVLRKFKPFQLWCMGFSLEGRPHKPSMVWLKFHQSEQFSRMHEALHSETYSLTKLEKKFRDPVPHITLARLGRRIATDRFILPSVSAECEIMDIRIMELWQSIAEKSGIKYHRIASFRLFS